VLFCTFHLSCSVSSIAGQFAVEAIEAQPPQDIGMAFEPGEKRKDI